MIAAALAASSVAQAQEKPGYTLSFQDEFDAGALDPNKWKRRFKWGEAVINSELQAYTDEQFRVAGGILEIVAEKKQATYAEQALDYASGLIASSHFQKYGYFEARMRLPRGQGLWPAFWLLAEVSSGVDEIDVMELLGHDPTTMYMTVHWGESYPESVSNGAEFSGPDFSADFHTYAVDWDEDSIEWYVDGELRHAYSGPGVPQTPLYMIANLAVGGTWPGNPDQTTEFPAVLAIDYVRTYRRGEPAADAGSAAGSDGPVETRPDFMGCACRQRPSRQGSASFLLGAALFSCLKRRRRR